MRATTRRLSRLFLTGAGCVAVLAGGAQARVTHIEIIATQTPTFDGALFGGVGQYEKLSGRIRGELDPADPLNAVITDLRLAPRNAAGMVEYASPFMIIRLVVPSTASAYVQPT